MSRILTIVVIPVLSILLVLTSSCGDNYATRIIDPESSDTTTKRGGQGKTVFLQKCASCHSILKNATGPPLDRVIQFRKSDWIFKFLTNRNVVIEDSISRSFKNEFPAVECLIFSDLTEKNVEEIVRYIEQRQLPQY
jgi:hypothetical protein